MRPFFFASNPRKFFPGANFFPPPPLGLPYESGELSRFLEVMFAPHAPTHAQDPALVGRSHSRGPMVSRPLGGRPARDGRWGSAQPRGAAPGQRSCAPPEHRPTVCLITYRALQLGRHMPPIGPSPTDEHTLTLPPSSSRQMLMPQKGTLDPGPFTNLLVRQRDIFLT